MKYTDTLSDILETATSSSAAICGNAGRYRSIVNGVSAFRMPSDSTRKKA
jgi:hypothetical protein